MNSKQTLTFVFVFVCLSCAYSLTDEAINENDVQQYGDCGAVRKFGGYMKTGVYKLWMNSTTSFKIVCIHEKNNSFNVIQRRVDGSVNFNQPWHSYQYGFGNAQGNFWIGLNQIYYFTSTGNTILTVNLQDWAGNNRNARYYFKLTEPNSYTLSIGQYSGDAGDSMSNNNGMRFATPDRPDNRGCAPGYQGGWWFNYCTYAFLNGKYYIGGPYTPSGSYYDGIYWNTWGGFGYSMKFAQMMLSNS